MRAHRLGEDSFGRFVTYHLDDGKQLKLSMEEIQASGGETEALRRLGLSASDERVPVRVRSSRGSLSEPIGTLPRNFDWRAAGVRHLLVDLRPGDFTFVDGQWEASSTLGPGDFEAIPAFRRN